MTQKSLWLRAETKAHEKRTPLTPKEAEKLVARGVKVYVEKFPERIFPDEEYAKVGCELVETWSWRSAPKDTLILGLKEIEDGSDPFIHEHCYFAHVLKGQKGAHKILSRYKKGGGKLFDLEYLVDENKRRIAAFGKWAGFVGAACSIDLYCHLELEGTKPHPGFHFYPHKDILVEGLKAKISKLDHTPNALVIGALGRCGTGATELFEQVGVEVTKWDLKETQVGGPFEPIIQHDIFVNTVLVQSKVPPFLDAQLMDQNTRLKVICDVSCDPNSDLNPLPIYRELTTWQEPAHRLSFENKESWLISIDNLPSMLPREASMDFAQLLYPHLEEFLFSEKLPLVWNNAYESFETKLKKLGDETRSS